MYKEKQKKGLQKIVMELLPKIVINFLFKAIKYLIKQLKNEHT